MRIRRGASAQMNRDVQEELRQEANKADTYPHGDSAAMLSFSRQQLFSLEMQGRCWVYPQG